MKDHSALRVHRVDVADPIADTRRGDYADAFEVRLSMPDAYPPETWVRAGLAASPAWVKRVIALLGFRRAPQPSADHLGAWRVIESSAEVVHLEMSLPLMQVVFVGRSAEPARRTLTTVLTYQRPVLSRLVWAVVGPAHRRTARRVITTVTSAPVESGEAGIDHAR